MSSYFIEDLELGMEASHEKTVSEGDIKSFADVSQVPSASAIR
jgi:hypothetical protein